MQQRLTNLSDNFRFNLEGKFKQCIFESCSIAEIFWARL